VSLTTVVQLAYLVSATLFVFGLKLLGSPASARKGNALAALAMLIAVVFTLIENRVLNWTGIMVGLIVGSLVGALSARRVKMTAMPQLVGLFNGMGGAASGLVAAAEFYRVGGVAGIGVQEGVTIVLGTLIGAVTLSGSAIAFAKLQELMTGNPITFPLQRTLNAILFAGLVGLGIALTAGVVPDSAYPIFTIVALALGVLLVIPIGGADMPVVVSLLNSYSGLAASAAGFVLGNPLLIIAGALVGASGLILTQQMCKAMNRSLANVAFGSFGGGSGGGADMIGDRTVRRADAEQCATVLAYAQSVVIVPGYGLAVAQAQHEVRKLMDALEARGVQVRFAIHPVAGRMPGHMNVLLAEADIPYPKLLDLEEINPDFDRTDAVVVVGANDVVNPLARNPDSVIAGMPILDVDRARTVIVIKRSLSPGFAGIDNPLFYLDNTLMFFQDAQAALSELVRAVREV
jgi:H+-translocating NAD(P) transhydrogenase subunit beta